MEGHSSHTHTHTYTHTHTHTRTCTHTRPHTHAHTLTHSLTCTHSCTGEWPPKVEPDFSDHSCPGTAGLCRYHHPPVPHQRGLRQEQQVSLTSSQLHNFLTALVSGPQGLGEKLACCTQFQSQRYSFLCLKCATRCFLLSIPPTLFPPSLLL